MISKVLASVRLLMKKGNLSAKEKFLYTIGNYAIELPPDHKLPECQGYFKNYDKKLKNIIQSIEKYKEKGIIVDIGANIGDTAAYIRSYSDAKIICVEGDEYYLNYLRKNLELLPNVDLYPKFVSGRNTGSNYQSKREKGTGRLEESDNDFQTVSNFISLSAIIKDNNICPESLELIKIDTDGFDFDILLANVDFIQEFKPNVYFEYDISYNKNDLPDSLEVIRLFESLGYSFVVYDNFGNLLLTIDKDCNSVFIKLNHYLQSCKIYNGGFCYLDVLTVADKRIINDIWENDALLLD